MTKACSKCFHNIATIGIICLNVDWGGCRGTQKYDVVKVGVVIDRDGVAHEKYIGQRKTRFRINGRRIRRDAIDNLAF